MKVCPQCNSTYSDETLNYCLTDGATLVSNEYLSESWQNEETLRDAGFILPDNFHQTSPNQSKPTFPSLETNLNSFSNSANRQSNVLKYIVLVLLLAVFGGVVYWVYFRDEMKSRIDNNFSGKNAEVKKNAVQLSAENESKLKEEVTTFLKSWNSANENRKVEEHIAHYADTLETYYKESGVDKNHVKADRLRAYERYSTITIEVDNLKIMPQSETAVIIDFDKTWTFKSSAKISNGSVQQEMNLLKKDGKWFIVSEKDLQVYYINNRLSNDSNLNSNTNQ